MLHRRNPNICIAHRMIRAPMSGTGMGSVLLNPGGAGGGSAYASVPEYEATTGREVRGGSLGEKLAALKLKPLSKKPQSIKF